MSRYALIFAFGLLACGQNIKKKSSPVVPATETLAGTDEIGFSEEPTPEPSPVPTPEPTPEIPKPQCTPSERIRYRIPHVPDVKECEAQTQTSQCIDDKPQWTGDYKYEVCSTLNYYQLNISDKNMLAISRLRDRALNRGTLLEEEKKKFDAILKVNGIPYTVSIRLKGDWTDHLKGDVWSFRVEVKNQESIDGIRKFSIQSSQTRNGYFELLFLKHQNTSGVLAPRANAAWYELNGKFLADVFIEEYFTNELIEASGFVKGPILAIQEDILWRDRYINGHWSFGHYARTFPIKSLNLPVKQGQTKEFNLLSDAYQLFRGWQDQNISDEEFQDKESVFKSLAFRHLYHAEHGEAFHNKRFYYDPYLKKFRPVNFDGNSGRIYLSSESPSWDPEYQEYLDKFLMEASSANTKAKIKSWLDEFAGETLGFHPPLTKQDLYNDYVHNLNMLINRPRATLAPKRRKSSPEVIYVDKLLAYYVEDKGSAFLEFQNISDAPATVSEIKLKTKDGPEVALLTEALTIPVLGTFEDHVKVPVEVSDLMKTTFLITYRLQDEAEDHTIAATWSTVPLQKHPYAISKEEFAAKFPFTRFNEEQHRVTILSGEYHISDDFITPNGYGLEIEPGTKIYVASGKKLVSKAEVYINGTQDNPVSLASEEEGTFWNGLLVLRGKDPSVIRHLMVKNIAEPITFYEAKVEIRSTKIESIQGDFGLSFVRSEFSGSDVQIAKSDSSGIGEFFSTGNITQL